MIIQEKTLRRFFVGFAIGMVMAAFTILLAVAS